MVYYNMYRRSWTENEAKKYVKIEKEDWMIYLLFNEVSEQVPHPIHSLNNVFFEEYIYLLYQTQFQLFYGLNDERRKWQTFLISGALSSQRCDIREITSWISGLFLIVFLAFIMLAFAYVFHTSIWQGNIGKNAPDNGRLDGIFAISVDRVWNRVWFGFNLSLSWLVQVHANLLRLETWRS